VNRRGGLVSSSEEQMDAAGRGGRSTGLAVLQRLAEVHAGRAWVEEREGGGASFRVFLPDVTEVAAEVAAEAAGRAGSPSADLSEADVTEAEVTEPDATEADGNVEETDATEE